MQRPLPPDLIRVVTLMRRGYSLRRIAGELGYSYSYLRKKLSLWRKRGYDIPRGRRGRRRSVQLQSGGVKEDGNIFLGKQKLLPSLSNYRERNEQSYVRLGRDDLVPHIVSIVLSEGGVHQGEIYRRLHMWGFRFSRETLRRAVRKLEMYGLVKVDHARGPRGNFITASPRLLSIALRGVHGVGGGGNNFVLGVAEYVENRFRRFEYGWEFVGLRPGVARWAQMYFRGGRWRVEFKPFRGSGPDRVAFVRDLLRVVSAVSVVVGLGWVDAVRMFAEEWAGLQG